MQFRLLLTGRSKSGKTGAIAALANAGYTVRMLDFDDNAIPLVSYTNKDKRKNLQIVTCLDKMRITGEETGNVDSWLSVRTSGGKDGLIAWKTAMDALREWPFDKTRPSQWDPKNSVFVIDSLSHFALARYNAVRVLQNRKAGINDFRDIGTTQREIESIIVGMKRWVACPLIVTAHLKLSGPNLHSDADISDENLQNDLMKEKLRGASLADWFMGVITVGTAQTNTLPTHFNGILHVEYDEAEGRVLLTTPRPGLDIGVPVDGLPAKLKIKDGLATVFKRLPDMDFLEGERSEEISEDAGEEEESAEAA